MTMNMSIKSSGINPLGGIASPVATLPRHEAGHGPEAMLKELESLLHPGDGEQGATGGGSPLQGGQHRSPEGGFKEALGGLSKLTMPIPGLSNVLKGASDAKGGPLSMLEGGLKGGLKVAEGAVKGGLGQPNPLMMLGGAYTGALQASDSTPEGMKDMVGKLPI